MSVAWKYINKPEAAIAAIGDYTNMRSIINNTPEEIKAVYEKMASPKASVLSLVPGSRNPLSALERVTDQIDQLDVLRERYSHAVDYMAWFEPAWGTLTYTEKLVLSEFYGSGNLRSGANARLQHRMNYSESHIERIKNKALARMIVLLFGR